MSEKLPLNWEYTPLMRLSEHWPTRAGWYPTAYDTSTEIVGRRYIDGRHVSVCAFAHDPDAVAEAIKHVPANIPAREILWCGLVRPYR